MYIKYFKNSKCLIVDITKNKAIEIQLTRDFCSWFNFVCRFSTKTDHAGLTFVLTLCKLEFSCQLYDKRHWNYEKGQWYQLGENIE